MTVIDLFAGPGGWDIGARAAGINTVGIEHDATACATRSAAQLATIRADLYHYPPRPCEGLIASPPCPAFSTAGNRKGVADLGHLAAGTVPAVWADPTSALIARVWDWIVESGCEWVALEQVPPVLPVWKSWAQRLSDAGWSAWAGVLNAADVGVPQTRRRAILIASRTRTVRPPDPTHDADPHPTLFGVPLKPWVSMAEALGWDGRAGFPRKDDRGDSPDGYRERDWFASGGQWIFTRPATTIQGDPRVWPPGHKINQADRDRLGHEQAEARYGDRAGTEAIKVEPHEAGILQGFPADYPWQGTRTAQFTQIGNAVPPPLARRLLEQFVNQPPTRP